MDKFGWFLNYRFCPKPSMEPLLQKKSALWRRKNYIFMKKIFLVHCEDLKNTSLTGRFSQYSNVDWKRQNKDVLRKKKWVKNFWIKFKGLYNNMIPCLCLVMNCNNYGMFDREGDILKWHRKRQQRMADQKQCAGIFSTNH